MKAERPDVASPLFAERAKIKTLRDILKLIDLQADYRPEVYGLTAERAGPDRVLLKLQHRALMRRELSHLPILHLDGTASETLAPYTFHTLCPEHTPDAVPLPDRPGRAFADVRYIKIKVQQPYATYIKVERAPIKIGDLTEGISCRPKQRLRRDHPLEVAMRAVRLLAERVPPNTDGSPSVGVFSYKAVHDYIERFGLLPEHAACGHYNAAAGLNRWQNAQLIINLGRPLISVEALKQLAHGYFALDPLAAQVDWRGGYTFDKEAGLRLSDGTGLATRTAMGATSELDELLQLPYRAQPEQVLARGRGIWCSEERRCLFLDFSDAVTDITYDAVVNWRAFAGVSEFDVMAQGIGLLPERPADWLKVAPGLFGSREQAKQLGWTRINDETVTNHYTYNNTCKSLVTVSSLLSSQSNPLDLSPATIIRGEITHPLLKPRDLACAEVEIKGCAPAQVLIDPNKYSTSDQLKKALKRNVRAHRVLPDEPS